MSLKRLALLFGLFSLGAPCAISSGEVKVFRLDYTVVREGHGRDGETTRTVLNRTRYLLADGARVRTETFDPVTRKRTVEISDDQQDELVVLDADHRTAIRTRGAKRRMLEGTPVFDTPGAVRGQKEALGKSRMQGFPCQGFRNTFPGGLTTETWFCTDPETGASFLGSVHSRQPDGASWREDLQKVTRDYAADASLFEVPDDYTVTDK
jgi:hypothetical protein